MLSSIFFLRLIRTTLRDFNRIVLKIGDTGYASSEPYDWLNIPAMVNTVTMTKLAWLSENGTRELLRDLEEKGYTSNTLTPLIKNGDKVTPPVLGFIRSLDHSNQWCEGQKLLFVLDPCVYRKLFLNKSARAFLAAWVKAKRRLMGQSLNLNSLFL
jgi:hypothetical protein